MASFSSDVGRRELTLADKIRAIQWGLVLLIAAIAGIGFAMLYSAANGNLQPWASRQMTRFAIALVPMIAAGLIDVRYWFRGAYWLYGASLVLIIAVDLLGTAGLGAQRWIDLGFTQLQPSELMKITLVLALARYFHSVAPEHAEPLGAGYHILQSKIALGSGGVFGKGFLLGTQSHLSFLPEKQTDFIFTMIAEEFGLVGGLVLLGLYVVVIGYAFSIALRSRSLFGRLLGLGIAASFFLYAFINIAMVMGLIPVVGVPLPLISYGGTAMITMMLGFGLLMNVGVHRDVRISRRGESELG